MRILVTGAAGLLGNAVVRTVGERGHDVRAFARCALDVTDPGEVERCLGAEKPEVVVHCAAYTAVDRAEEELDQAMIVTRDGTRNVAMAAAQIGATVVYPSTDHVFNGRADTPYGPDAETSPLNAYGVSKLAGEQVLAVSGCSWMVVRTSWLYGPGGRDFVDVVLEQAQRRRRDDRGGRPGGLPDVDRQPSSRNRRVGRSGCDGNVPPLRRRPGLVARTGTDGGGARPDSTSKSRPRARSPGVRPRSVLLIPYSTAQKAERILGREMSPWRESLHTYLSETL